MKVAGQCFILIKKKKKNGWVDFTEHILKECFQTVNEAC